MNNIESKKYKNIVIVGVKGKDGSNGSNGSDAVVDRSTIATLVETAVSDKFKDKTYELMDTLKTDLVATTTGLKDDIDNFKKRVFDDIDQQQVMVNSAITNLNEVITVYDRTWEKINEGDNGLSTLNDRLSGISTKVGLISNELERNSNKIGTIEHTIAKLDTNRLETAIKATDDIKEKLNVVTENVSIMKNDIKENTETLSGISDLDTEKINEAIIAVGAINGVTAKLDNVETAVSTYTAKVDGAETKIATLSSLTSSNTTALSGLTTKITDVESSLTANNTMLTKLDTTVTSFKNTTVALNEMGINTNNKTIRFTNSKNEETLSVDENGDVVINGKGYLEGFSLPNVITIDSGNAMSFVVHSDVNNRDEFDFSKCGNVMIIQSLPTNFEALLFLPSIERDWPENSATVDTKARRYIGQKFVVVNLSGIDIKVSGALLLKDDPTRYTSVLAIDNTVTIFESQYYIYNGKEAFDWIVSSGECLVP